MIFIFRKWWKNVSWSERKNLRIARDPSDKPQDMKSILFLSFSRSSFVETEIDEKIGEGNEGIHARGEIFVIIWIFLRKSSEPNEDSLGDEGLTRMLSILLTNNRKYGNIFLCSHG